MRFLTNCAYNIDHFLTFSPKIFIDYRVKKSKKVKQWFFLGQMFILPFLSILYLLYWLFPHKKWFFPQNVHAYWALFWLFCPIVQCVFTPKIPKKLFFPQIATIIQGTLLTFLPKKVIFSQNAPAYRTLFRLFCPINQMFLHKNSQKLIFPQIAPMKQGTLLTFLQKNDFLLRMRLHIEHYFDFFAQ